MARVPDSVVTRTLAVSGSQLHIEERQGRACTTVWLHHGVGSTRAWDGFLPSVADGRRCIAYDRRGFGRSAHRRRFLPTMFDEDMADLHALLVELGVGRAHLVGHSDGGTVALLLASRHPDLVASVAVIAVHVRGDATTMATLGRMGPPAGWPEPLRRSLERSHGADWKAVAAAWHGLWTSPAFRDWSIVEELSGVQCPVLVVHDRRDDLSPPLHAEIIAGKVRHAALHWVDSGTHYPHRDDKSRFAELLRCLWRDAEAAAPRGRGSMGVVGT